MQEKGPGDKFFFLLQLLIALCSVPADKKPDWNVHPYFSCGHSPPTSLSAYHHTLCRDAPVIREREGGETQAQVCHPRPAPLPTSCLPRIVISYSRSRFPSPPSCSHRSGEERDTLFNSAKDTAHTQPSSPK